MTRKRRSMADLLGDPAPAKRAPGRPIADHRQKLVLAQAEQVELRNAKMRGELIPAADVVATWSGLIADARQRFLAIPSRLGAKLALPRETVAAVDAEIRAVLTALAAGRGRGGDSDAG